MPIEWAVISALVIKFLKTYATGRAKKLAKKQLDSVFAKITTQATLTKLNKAFAIRFGKELDSVIDLPTLETEPYRQALQLFLPNPSVQDILLAPLDGESPVDWKFLRGIWAETRAPGSEHLITLPEDFDWAKVAKLYAKAVERLSLADPQLRPAIQALAAIRTAEASKKIADATDRIAGPARAFDLPRYARAIKETFAHLQLAPLTDDWTYYEREHAISLDTIYARISILALARPQYTPALPRIPVFSR